MLDTLALLLALELAVAALWSPVLLSGRLRSLFRAIPPTESTAGSFLLVAAGLSVPFLAGTLGVLATTSTEGAALSNALLGAAFLLALGYVVLLPMLAGAGLPRWGVDWDATGYGAGTWLVLVVATLWYVAVFVLPLAFFAFVFALPTG